jgi:putative FmdB family regulatory protein
MPVYEFLCQTCGNEFTQILSLTEYEAEYEQHQVACPNCGSKLVEQLVAACSVVTSRKS